MHPDDVERMRIAAAEEAMSTGGPWNHTFRMIAGDGRVVWLLDRGQAIGWDEPGRPTRFQGVLPRRDRRARGAARDPGRRRPATAPSSSPCPPCRGPRSSTRSRARAGTSSSAVRSARSSATRPRSCRWSRTTSSGSCIRTIATGCARRATGATARESPWDELYRVQHRDGSVHWILSTGDPVVRRRPPGLARRLARRDEAHRRSDEIAIVRPRARESDRDLIRSRPAAAPGPVPAGTRAAARAARPTRRPAGGSRAAPPGSVRSPWPCR